jgi:fructokinase
VVKISDDELTFLTGDDDVTPLWRDSTRLIVVTHGAGGATAYPRAGEPVHAAGFSVEPVDTTGAGDGFVAGLLSGVLEHPDDYLDRLPPMLRFANAVGALTTTQRGAIPALPLREQVDAFLLDAS